VKYLALFCLRKANTLCRARASNAG
jgi:hypothetical protein